MSDSSDDRVFEEESQQRRSDDIGGDKPVVPATQSGLSPVVAILIALVGAAVAGGAMVWTMNFLEPPQDKSIKASYRNLAKKQKTSSPFPELLTASFRRLSDRWGANGPVGDADLIKLCREQQIDALQLSYTEITHKGLQALSSEPIVTLLITGGSIEVPEAKALSKVKTLERLDIANSKKTDDEVVANLTDLPELKWLSIRRCTLTDRGVATLVRNFKNLEALDVMDSPITDASIDSIKSLANLNSLNISCTRISNNGVKKLFSSKYTGAFYGTDLGIRDDTVEKIAGSNCWNVNLSGNPITDKSLARMAKLKILAHLAVSHCALLTNVGISKFRKERPDCELVLDKGYFKRKDQTVEEQPE